METECYDKWFLVPMVSEAEVLFKYLHHFIGPLETVLCCDYFLGAKRL